jgi:murein tripeptide amidase MpaA
MTISADFECGNIIVESKTASDVALSIRADSNAKYFQWFYFKDTPIKDIERRYRIYNAYAASYHKAWGQYNVLASYDEKEWFRIPTYYDGSHLIWSHRAEQEQISFAFFVPYLAERRANLIKQVRSLSHVSHSVLGKTLQGNDSDLLVFGDESRTDVKKIWIVSRQHAGEPMAEYATEAIILRLTDTNDTEAQKLLEKATVYIVPNVNPDGTALGNLRANSAGVDLNRIWDNPKEDAIEVKLIVDKIAETGVDYFIDVHGDEERPFIWIIQPDVEFSAEIGAKQDQFVQYLADHHQENELQDPPTEIVGVEGLQLGMSINTISTLYNCPAWTVELPFKETPVGDTLLEDGCLRFGRLCVDALLTVID